MMSSAEVTEDRLLFSKIKSGDEQAFKQVYYRHHAKIFHFANSFLKDKDQSEEILQETFLTFWVKREKFVIDTTFEPILYTICRRLIIDAFRKSSIAQRYQQNLKLMMTEVGNQTEDHVIFSDLLRITENVVAELPEQQQHVFRLSKYDGLSYEEIAQKLNISKNTVRNHLFVALKTLKSRLGKDGILYCLFIILFDTL
ncbi:RNA polymerase sigma factor [Pedobacter helvus]|uniref:RNA polymerase sigma factor n=1 Tax=Pedobacter helvus TaxID=2563444 RepID=A0ABW9JDQ7_9SPHI|nr:RNA polymerase sigma-70 factor [Pedobacter ureilyticus]